MYFLQEPHGVTTQKTPFFFLLFWPVWLCSEKENDVVEIVLVLLHHREAQSIRVLTSLKKQEMPSTCEGI
jgi:hypothetical protein